MLLTSPVWVFQVQRPLKGHLAVEVASVQPLVPVEALDLSGGP